MNSSFAFDHPDEALRALGNRLQGVTETVSVTDPIGRILGEPLLADRDSPAADVSAMDGYAIRMSDLKPDFTVSVSGESQAGSPPPSMESGKVVRIFTGAIVPSQCEAVVKREDTEELDGAIRFRDAAIKTTKPGMHIRRAGENASAGSHILAPGIEITPAVMAALANFGQLKPQVFRAVRVSILTTGNEVVEPSAKQLQPWQLRNSNRCSVEAMVGRANCAAIQTIAHQPDDRESLRAALTETLGQSDAVVLTGGVSKGDYDYVPEMIAALGQIVFHGLPIRPGKPILGAVTKDGKLILGLPGNPVSATINAHRFLIPLLRRLAGQLDWHRAQPLVELLEAPVRAIPLHTMLLAQLVEDGKARLVAGKGSGDLVALSQSDGYVAVAPGSTSTGPWPFYRW